MEKAIETQSNGNLLERVVIMGDLSGLKPEERMVYYKAVCTSIGLNPLTKPFDYITLNGKLTLYARKDATDQLRKIHDVSITKLERDRLEDVYTVTAYAQDKGGRVDVATGAVSIKGLSGDALANAVMKAETKSKRRVTLSICGLGILDESEVETIPDARPYVEVVEPEPPAPAEKKPQDFDYSSLPEMVRTFKNGDGVLYIDLETKTLTYMLNSMTKWIKNPANKDSENMADAVAKCDIIKAILKLRSEQSV
jgi:hypothetical protein